MILSAIIWLFEQDKFRDFLKHYDAADNASIFAKRFTGDDGSPAIEIRISDSSKLIQHGICVARFKVTSSNTYTNLIIEHQTGGDSIVEDLIGGIA